jgi:biopolymer transport protein ExbB
MATTFFPFAWRALSVWESAVHWLQAGVVAFLLKGGIVMIPLLICSVISVTVIAERYWVLRHLRSGAIDVDTTILTLVAEGSLAAAMRVATRSWHPIARVLLAGLENKDLSPSRAMEGAARAEMGQLKRYLPILDTIITLAPLLGLLGTITGMISAFGIMSEAGLAQPHNVTGGIAEALIATATGLLIAIMTLVPYNYFNAKVEQFITLMEERATRLELLLGGQKE